MLPLSVTCNENRKAVDLSFEKEEESQGSGERMLGKEGGSKEKGGERLMELTNKNLQPEFVSFNIPFLPSISVVSLLIT